MILFRKSLSNFSAPSKNFKGESRLSTYLYRMAVNTAIDHVRKAGKPIFSSLEEKEGFQPAEEPEKRPDRIFLYKELEGKVNEALSEIPVDQRTALVLREVEGLSYQEIAESMGCSHGNGHVSPSLWKEKNAGFA